MVSASIIRKQNTNGSNPAMRRGGRGRHRTLPNLSPPPGRQQNREGPKLGRIVGGVVSRT